MMSTSCMHQNNFDFLRLLFAVFVIITHSYSLSGLKECDLLCRLSDEQTLLSYIGVRAFFIISGYLIFQSLLRSHSLTDYFWKRLLRLYPALAVMLLITICLAPIVYENPEVPYLLNPEVWTYVPRNLSLFFAQFKIRGIFENNPYPAVINGTLWTIHYEFFMYLMVALLWRIRHNKKALTYILAFTYVLLLLINVVILDLKKSYFTVLNTNALANLGFFFASGALLAVLDLGKSKHLKTLTLAAFIGICFSLFLSNSFYQLQFLFLPVLVIGFGLQKTPFISGLAARIGDLSYGMYIYGFLVQQVLVYYLKLSYAPLLFWSLLITSIFSYLSWHYIELKFLHFKKLDIKGFLSKRQGQSNFKA